MFGAEEDSLLTAAERDAVSRSRRRASCTHADGVCFRGECGGRANWHSQVSLRSSETESETAEACRRG